MHIESSRPGAVPAHAARSPAAASLRLPARLGHLLCLDDFEAAARRHLPGPVFAYISEAVERGDSLHANRATFGDYSFIPRVMVDIMKRTTAATVLGSHYSAPFGIAPMGLCSLSGY